MAVSIVSIVYPLLPRLGNLRGDSAADGCVNCIPSAADGWVIYEYSAADGCVNFIPSAADGWVSYENYMPSAADGWVCPLLPMAG